MWNVRKSLIAAALLMSALPVSAQEFDPPHFESSWCKEKKSNMDKFVEAKKDIAEPMNDFALGLWKASEKKGANPVMSPWSIYTVLSMALGGAEGTTAKEMAAAMGQKEVPTAKWYELHKNILANLLCPGPYATTLLSYGNGVFVQKGKGLQPKFVSLMKSAFDSEPTELDFKKDPENSRKAINQWVDTKTQKRIPELLGKDAIKSDSRLVLANAVFIKGTWDREFQESETKDRNFFLTKTEKVKTPTMHTTGNASTFRYYKGKDFSAVSMNTEDHAVEFVVIRPDEIDGLKSLEKNISGETLSNLFTSLKGRKVNLYLPKFEGDQSWNLIEGLSKIGIKAAFSSKAADFKGIDGGADLLFIGDVAHQAMVKVDEKGFEGAAATAANMRAGSAPPKEEEPIEFVVDRPFLYLIKDKPTDAILFIGTVSNPAK